jgi:FkbM family methyltransferase
MDTNSPEQTRSDHVKGVVVKTAQGYFCVDPKDQFVSKSILETGAYGLGEIALAKQFSNAQSKVLVVGAHIGTIAIPLSRACRELVAIEANPKTYELLRLNVLINGCTNLRAYDVAANHKEELIQFVMNAVNSGGSKRMPKFRDQAYFYDTPEVVTVHGVRLDHFLDSADFDLVFMDIEGSEYFAFLGMQTILSRARTLIVEFIPHHLSRVAGISVEEFLLPLASHFNTLIIPTKRLLVRKDDFVTSLQSMFDQNEGDAAIIFDTRPDLRVSFASATSAHQVGSNHA